MLAPGVELTPKRARKALGSPAYRRLEEAGRALTNLISRSRGWANKDLAKFADQLKALVEKWDK